MSLSPLIRDFVFEDPPTSQANTTMVVTKRAHVRNDQADVPSACHPVLSNTDARASRRQNQAVGGGKAGAGPAHSVHHKRARHGDHLAPVHPERQEFPGPRCRPEKREPHLRTAGKVIGNRAQARF